MEQKVTMKPKTKKILLWVAAILAILFLLMVVGFFIFRNQILEKTISKVADKMKTEYQSDFLIKEANFFNVLRSSESNFLVSILLL